MYQPANFFLCHQLKGSKIFIVNKHIILCIMEKDTQTLLQCSSSSLKVKDFSGILIIEDTIHS